MWKTLKAYIKDMGYWGLIVILPMILDLIGLIQLATGKQLLGISSWIWFQVAILFFLIMPFIAYHKMYVRLEEYKSKIRLIARPSSYRFNLPNPELEKPLADDETSIDITIQLEIWTDIDVSTASLILNIVGIRTIGRWQEFWKFLFQNEKDL